MTTSRSDFSLDAMLGQANAFATAQLARLDDENRLRGGEIAQLLRAAFDAALQDDSRPAAEQIAAAKELQSKLVSMLSLLNGDKTPATLTTEQQLVLDALASGRLVVDKEGGIRDKEWSRIHPRSTPTAPTAPATTGSPTDPGTKAKGKAKPTKKLEPSPKPAAPAAPTAPAATGRDRKSVV